MSTSTLPEISAAARAASLLDQHRVARVEATGDGYFDVLGRDAPPIHNIAQWLMRTKFYSTGYQLVRPIGLRLASGIRAPGRDKDRQRIAHWLGLRPGHTILDIGCGPGNFTGWFGAQVFPAGLAVGVDASRQMLRRAVADNSGPCVAYVRADAEHLPFADNVADAVTCLAALYLINEPFLAIQELVRVLAPGGKLAILTSLAPGGVSQSLRGRVMYKTSGVRMFGREEITGFLHGAGLTGVTQHVEGLAQFIIATKANPAVV
ncbi:class I SAM-dependent methyltransferase [Mycobacteroides chelonae]|uniref:Methyltransferase n=1 Tax=Mycobacteroides chelonae TaxID=1774 RepID=A0A1S1M0L7_MYCCH|nr:methyltransferase domain-containing protein [Mycobacteroides chelonae]OHU53262.1 methyltransferase [Mycobacteroides chelonae]OHU78179.1 methyltransferase [Mycobacteroides chelonae]QQG86636.1 methyltransferase domain-containing protein [Mycobacteroides chelonae]QQG91453.1 methyltransferase domain-containing protein [Mycobacteroides chelonae]